VIHVEVLAIRKKSGYYLLDVKIKQEVVEVAILVSQKTIRIEPIAIKKDDSSYYLSVQELEQIKKCFMEQDEFRVRYLLSPESYDIKAYLL